MKNQATSIDMSPQKHKRPKLVWIITIFYIFSAGYTLLSFVLIYGGLIPLNETQQAYFNSLNIFDISLIIITGVLNLIGAIMLFLLRKFAYYAFLSAFILSMLMIVYQAIFKDWISAIGSRLIGAVIGWCISIAIILYAKSLMSKEILK